MSAAVLFSVIESPRHPDFSALYARLGFSEVKLRSMRNAIAELKRQVPEVVVAEFFYGYGNNYAGVNISNLDVLLASLQKYAPRARVVVLVDPAERRYADQLADLFPLHAIVPYPVQAQDLEALLKAS